MIDQPILTRWENVSLGFGKYLKKRIGFVQLCKAITNMFKIDNDKNKVASDHIFLSKEDALITMAYFL